jgi:ATP-dependent RNA helicase DeaD
MDHSLVELPADLPADTWQALRGTRISGKLIELQRDEGAPAYRPSGQRRPGDKPDRKPRHKS